MDTKDEGQLLFMALMKAKKVISEFLVTGKDFIDMQPFESSTGLIFDKNNEGE